MTLAVYKVRFTTNETMTDEQAEEAVAKIQELMDNFGYRANLAGAAYCPKGVKVEVEE